ncbi:hypothetical protein AK88_00739 [Plasmodium fragile]|uniref:Uncharacterized protein n=1 Tax=Plasmodium fragile TaxID=5857 RepID=A0A0D9QRE7_PLAFR|nr:uncharacterized protein AK88_00739 [Plasmodium fragile]KJP89528.1 hypothetical protein AK88_00739 [Plasmodium fragile]
MGSSPCEEGQVVKSPTKIIFFYEDIVEELKAPKNLSHESCTPLKGRNNDEAKENYKNNVHGSEESSALFIMGEDNNKPEGEEKNNGRLLNTDILNDTVCSSRGKYAFERGNNSKVGIQEEGKVLDQERSDSTFANECIIHESPMIRKRSNEDMSPPHEMEHVNPYTREEGVKGNMCEGICGVIFTCDSGDSSGSLIEENEEDSLEREKTVMIPSNCESSSAGGDANVPNSNSSSESTRRNACTNAFEDIAAGKETELLGQPPEGTTPPSSSVCPTELSNHVGEDIHLSQLKKSPDKDRTSDTSSDNFADLNLSDSSLGSAEDVVAALSRGSEDVFKMEGQINEYSEKAIQDWVKKWQDCFNRPNIDNELEPSMLGKLPEECYLGEDKRQREREGSGCDHSISNPLVGVCNGGNGRNTNTHIYSEQMKEASSGCSLKKWAHLYNPMVGKRKKRKKKKKVRQNGPIMRDIESAAHAGCCDYFNSRGMTRDTRKGSHSMGTFRYGDAPLSSNKTRTCICTDGVGNKTNTIRDGRNVHMLLKCNQCRLYDLFRQNNRALSEVYFNMVTNSCRNDFQRRGRNQLQMEKMVRSGEEVQLRCCPHSLAHTNWCYPLHSTDESLCHDAICGLAWGGTHVNQRNVLSCREHYCPHWGNDDRGDCKSYNDGDTNIQDSISVLEEKYASVDGSTETIPNGVRCGGKMESAFKGSTHMDSTCRGSMKMNHPFAMPYHDCAFTRNDSNIYPPGHAAQGRRTWNSCFARRLAQVSYPQRGGTSSWSNMVQSNAHPYGVFPPRATCTTESDAAVSEVFPGKVPSAHVQENKEKSVCDCAARGKGAYEGRMVHWCTCDGLACCGCLCCRSCCCGYSCDERLHDQACKIVNWHNVLDNQLPSNYIDVDASPEWVRGSLFHCAAESGDRKAEKQQRKEKGGRSSNIEADKLNDVPRREEELIGDERKTIQKVAPGKGSHPVRETNMLGNSNESEKNSRVCHVSSKNDEICVFPQEEQKSLEGITMGNTRSVGNEDRNVDMCIEESSRDYNCEQSADGSNPKDAPPDGKKKKKNEKNNNSPKDFNRTKKQKKKKRKKKILNVKKYYDSNSTNLFWSDLRNLNMPQVTQVEQLTEVAELTQLDKLTRSMHTGGASRDDTSIQDHDQYENVNLQSTHIKKYELRTKRKVKYAWPSIIKKLRRDDSRLVYDPFLYNSTWRIKKA